MSFAQKILEKYGWKEGDGLGKKSNGIVEPLKANLKFDNAGLGVDRADEFNNHWWERVFNEAAKNVEVKNDGDKICVNRKDEESVEITTKQYSVRKLKKHKRDSYENFLSSATRTNTGDEVEKVDKIEVDDIKLVAYKPLTDEELFAACGGRTAHKGARHGLKLSGKLARIEQQEKEMLLKMDNNISEEASSSWTLVKNKKKKKNKEKTEEKDSSKNEVSVPEDDEESKLNNLLFTAEYHIKSKKKRKEKKKTEEELSESLVSCSLQTEKEHETLLGLCDNSKTIKKEKRNKKSKRKENIDSTETYREVNDSMENSFEEEANQSLGIQIGEEIDIEPKKKAKKCKHGIDKDAKKAHKTAKKIKKNLRHITEDLERSVLIGA